MIGSKEARETYVKKKVEKWVKDVEELSEIALDEPQAALPAFTKAFCHRWTFVMRTIQGTSELFIPLEKSIREKLIPAIIGRSGSDLHRRMFIVRSTRQVWGAWYRESGRDSRERVPDITQDNRGFGGPHLPSGRRPL